MGFEWSGFGRGGLQGWLLWETPLGISIPSPQAAAAKELLPAVVRDPAVTGSPAHGHCLTAGFVPENQGWNIFELGVTSVHKYLQVTGLFWICPTLFQFCVNVALLMYRVGSTRNFWKKPVFSSIIAFQALVLLLLVLQHSFSWGFEQSVCCPDILKLQFLKVKEPKELFIAAEGGLPLL